MTNFERLEKTRQLEKLKSDCLFYEYVSPVVEFLAVCGVMAVVGGVFGFETLVGSIVGFAVLATSCVAVILKEKEAEKELQKINSQMDQLTKEFDEDAKEKVEKTDEERASYYYEHTGKTWGDVNDYHMILDTSELGVENCADILMHYFEKLEYI